MKGHPVFLESQLFLKFLIDIMGQATVLLTKLACDSEFVGRV